MAYQLDLAIAQGGSTLDTGGRLARADRCFGSRFEQGAVPRVRGSQGLGVGGEFQWMCRTALQLPGDWVPQVSSSSDNEQLRWDCNHNNSYNSYNSYNSSNYNSYNSYNE